MTSKMIADSDALKSQLKKLEKEAKNKQTMEKARQQFAETQEE